MAKFLVEYWPCISFDLAGREVPCYRIFPEGEREHWIAQTNADWPREAQEEVALLIADALSKILGI